MGKGNPVTRTEKIFLCTLFLSCIFYISTFHSSSITENDSRSRGLKPGERPIIKTFYSPLPKLNDEGEEIPPTDSEKEDPILNVWKSEWTKAGFEPVIITIEDAKRHPFYNEMKIVIEKVKPGDYYNQYCFYRHLAMAATGGGWHSDIDAMPANFPLDYALDLPNDGKFTSFESYVPSLISATEEEWSKISKLITFEASRYDVENERLIPSDMNMFRKLKAGGSEDIIFMESGSYVMGASYVVKGKNIIDCSTVENIIGIHFSHASLHRLWNDGFFPLDIEGDLSQSLFFNEPEHRANAIERLMDGVRACLSKSTAEE